MILKKLTAAFMATVIIANPLSINARAKSTSYMDGLNINWDLRPDGVAIPFETYVAGVGYKTATVKFTKCDIKDIGGGRVKVKLKAVFKDKSNLTDKEIHKVANSSYDVKRYYHVTVVDYNTGKTVLDENSNYKIVKDASKVYEIYDSHGCSTDMCNASITLTFEMDKPKVMKDTGYGIMCVTAGGSTKKLLKNESYNDSYYDGKAKFDDTSYVGNNVQITHAMKIVVE